MPPRCRSPLPRKWGCEPLPEVGKGCFYPDLAREAGPHPFPSMAPKGDDFILPAPWHLQNLLLPPQKGSQRANALVRPEDGRPTADAIARGSTVDLPAPRGSVLNRGSGVTALWEKPSVGAPKRFCLFSVLGGTKPFHVLTGPDRNELWLQSPRWEMDTISHHTQWYVLEEFVSVVHRRSFHPEIPHDYNLFRKERSDLV